MQGLLRNLEEKLSCIFLGSLAILPDLWYDITVNIKLIEALLNCSLAVSSLVLERSEMPSPAGKGDREAVDEESRTQKPSRCEFS